MVPTAEKSIAAAGSRRAWSNSANERPQVACIGVGGKGGSDSSNAALFGDVLAICDVDRKTLASKHKADAFKAAETFTDYREMIADPEIEAVIIATPDHWHGRMAAEAARRGKHIYMEAPMTRSLEETKALKEAVN